MRKATLTFFLVAGGTQAPEPALTLDISAATMDGLREAATAALEARGMKVRAISFGPKGLVAYAEAK